MISSEKYQKNFYESLDEAIESANNTLRSRSEYWVWKTDEDLFEWVAIPNPQKPSTWDVVFMGRTTDLRRPSSVRRMSEQKT